MSVDVTEMLTGGLYFSFDRVFIMADHPKAAEQMLRCPDCPVVNQKALELITELTRGKATAEGKLALLKEAIIYL